ncbi:MAG: ribosome biogenesis GTP-binding protein YihA/YsxC [Gemmatimonadota bacterium]
MRIKSVDFAGAIAKPGGEPPGALPEIAFAGRSNVGKSSLINRLLGRTRTNVARVSRRPGKTREINFYRVRAALAGGAGDIEFFLVDLPGYGYARVPEAVRERWADLIEGYLSASPRLRGVVQLVDGRHGLTGTDRTLVRYLAGLGLPVLFVLTKADKVKRSKRRPTVEEVVEELDVDRDQVLLFSAKTGEGRETLLESLEHLLRSAEDEG